MSLLQAWIDRVKAIVNPQQSIALGIADDGSGSSVDPGKPAPLRVDPATGELLVKSSGGGGGGGGGEVTQGAGSGTAGNFWTVRVSDGSAFIPLPTALGSLGGLKVQLLQGEGETVAVTGPLTDDELRASPVPTSNTAASQVDGHSATIGTTTDLDSANTLIGRLKNLLSRIPAALVGGRFDGNVGSWFGSTVPTVGQKTAAQSIPVVFPSDQSIATETTLSSLNGKFVAAATLAAGGSKPSTTQIYSWVVCNNPGAWGGANTAGFPSGNEYGVAVQGYNSDGSSIGATERPVWISGWDGTSKRALRLKASNPIATEYGLLTREIPLQRSTVKTTAGTPAASLVVRNGPCWLYDIWASNATATACFVTVYNLTAAPSHGTSAASRLLSGRRIGQRIDASTPSTLKESHGGIYFSTGCVIVIENADDDANVNSSGAPTLTINATFVAGT